MRKASHPLLIPLGLVLLVTSSARGQDPSVLALDVSHWSGEITAQDVACWRANGVEHLVPGTQVESLARQQLQTALDGGLTVDAYVVLYWDQDIRSQVEAALDVVRGFPIGRLWLDIEVYPAGRSVAQLEALIQQGFDACGAIECGIYTGKWWWDAYMPGSTRFAQAPVWYAYYDNVASLGTWAWQAFGGWPFATGKQYGFDYLCGVNVDFNVMRVGATPGGDPPPVPTGLTTSVGSSAVTLSVASPLDAMGYEFEIEYFDGASWQGYTTYQPSEPSQTFWPAFIDTAYRFRVRAQNAFGWSGWSERTRFDFGAVGTAPSAPTVLSPPPGAVITESSVTLEVGAIEGATRYELEIEYWAGAAWQTYYTYRPTLPRQTFWPAFANTAYRFRARAENGFGLGPWSEWSGFDFGAVPRLPEAPSPTSPEDGAVVTTSSVTLGVAAIAGATGYEFAIEYWDGAAWQAYYTYAPATNQQAFWPAFADTAYRFRARAENGFGPGPWSVWSHFDFGNVLRLPPAPSGLSPAGGAVVTASPVTLSADPVADASGYEIAIEYWDGTSWQVYYTYAPTTSAQTFWPYYADTAYRWRIRAENAAGFGAWSAWAELDFGIVSRPPPAPTGMSPADGAVVSGSSVTLRVDAIDDATGYEFDIWYSDGTDWQPYYTYTPAANAQTFWPVFDDTLYLWRVRAKNGEGFGPWSEETTFAFGNVGPPPVAGGWSFPWVAPKTAPAGS